MRLLAPGVVLGASLLAAGCSPDRAAAGRNGALPAGLCSSPVSVEHGFLVFFDPGSAMLTDRARQVIREVAEVQSRVGASLVVVRSHVDGVEARGRPGLDGRRAAAVRGELLAQGLAAEVVATVAEGASRMLLPADPADPQNRYVTFTLTDLAQRRSTPALQACAAWLRATCLPPATVGNPASCDAALRFLDGKSP